MEPTRTAAKVPPDEADLVLRAQAGDRQAFATLTEHYWDRLYRWLYHLTHDRHAAEDLAQDTFLKAYTHLASFRAGSHFQAWLFRIAYNGFLNSRRQAARRPLAFPEDLPGSAAGPDEEAVSRETLELVAQAVTRLPEEFRAALLLRLEEGMSFRAIAAVLRVTEETARWRVFKARQKLMAALGPHLDNEP